MKSGKTAVKKALGRLTVRIRSNKNSLWQRSIHGNTFKTVSNSFIFLILSLPSLSSTPPSLPEMILRFHEVKRVISTFKTTDKSLEKKLKVFMIRCCCSYLFLETKYPYCFMPSCKAIIPCIYQVFSK